MQEYFREPLAGTHHVGRIDRFIGRDKDKPLNFKFLCQAGDGTGAKQVVLQCLDWLMLHDRHMLVGGSMKDQMRTVAVEYFPHARLVADIPHQGKQVAVG